MNVERLHKSNNILTFVTVYTMSNNTCREVIELVR